MLQFINPQQNAYVINAANKIHPLCGIYHKSALPIIKEQIEKGDYRLMNLLRVLQTREISLTHTLFNSRVVANINDRETYKYFTGPKVFAISGVKNSVKTTLITKLIMHFKAEGCKVGTIKHDGHDFEIDVENTDSFKHRRAGSDGTIIFSQSKFAVIKSAADTKVEDLLPYLSEMDLIILEGFKFSSYPKIEVIDQVPVCDESSVFAYAAANDFTHQNIPVVHRNDIKTLVSMIDKTIFQFEKA
jgi:molybdopterin-guanine dinucleotide biosynthesis protein MobB